MAAAQGKYGEAREEAQHSENLLEVSRRQEQAARQQFDEARERLELVDDKLQAAQCSLATCEAQPCDESGDSLGCASEASDVAQAQAALGQAQADAQQAACVVEQARENGQAMAQRVEYAQRAVALAETTLERAQAECAVRMASVSQSVDEATGRLAAAQQALNAYLATDPTAAQFHAWLHWDPAQQGRHITPNQLRDRMNLSPAQQRLFQAYLHDRDPAYRDLVNKYRGAWAAARGEAERNLVARKARTHLSGTFAEHMVRHALAPLGEKIATQGRTYVGDSGRYTKTDLLVTGLRVPVILGRGEGMGAPVGGSMAFEVKCGQAGYLYGQKAHMVFQAEGHKQADAQCTICSRDIRDLPPEKEKELRETLRTAGSPLVGMLPRKDEIDRSCQEFIHGTEEDVA